MKYPANTAEFLSEIENFKPENEKEAQALKLGLAILRDQKISITPLMNKIPYHQFNDCSYGLAAANAAISDFRMQIKIEALKNPAALENAKLYFATILAK